MIIHDTIVIGAGIVGATVAHALHNKDEKVVVLEAKGVASGGSGAAGAFVSPKIGLDSSLHALTNEAFSYAVPFYEKYCAKHFHKTGVIRVPKDKNDAEKFPIYEKFNPKPYENISVETLHKMGIDSHYDGFYFPKAGDCDALAVCDTLLKGIDVQMA